MKYIGLLTLLFVLTFPLLTSAAPRQQDIVLALNNASDIYRGLSDATDAKDAVWNTLAKIEVSIDKKKGIYEATIPDEVHKLDGTTFQLSGYMLPLDATKTFKRFLLTRRAPSCPFCPPGQPNQIIEVHTLEPVAWSENLILLQGRFELTDNKESGIFFKMTEATLK